VRLLALAVALGWLASSVSPIGTSAAVADELHLAYAPRKVASPFRTDGAGAHLAFPGALPERGGVVAIENALSPQANWIIVDLEAGTIRRAITRLSDATRDGKSTTVIERDVSRDLTVSQTNAVIRAMNTIWATLNPASIDASGRTDALCSMAFFDRDDVLHEFGAACPRAQFAQMLTALAERPR
jgi:hypothetical protein